MSDDRDELIDGSAICCRPGELRERVAEYEQAGATTLLANVSKLFAAKCIDGLIANEGRRVLGCDRVRTVVPDAS